MSSDIKITYVNRSLNLDHPKVFLFAKNEIPTFDSLRNGVAWKVIEKVGRNSSCIIPFPVRTDISASWNNGSCLTNVMQAEPGCKYAVSNDDTGIVLMKDGNALNTTSIDVHNKVHTPNGISVDLYKDGRVMATEHIVGYDQKATFVLHPKLYWGLASEIQEGEQISSAVLNCDSFFEQNLEGVSEVTVALHGNAQDGYRFEIESQR